MSQSQTVWTNMALADEDRLWLTEQIKPFTLVESHATASNLTEGAGDENCRAATIAFGQPAVGDVLASKTLKWVHLTSAGYTRYDLPEVLSGLQQRSAQLTNSSHVYDDPCAEHVFTFMLAHNRLLAPCLEEHRGTHEWRYAELRSGERRVDGEIVEVRGFGVQNRRVRILRDERVLIVGFGAIATRLVELLAPFGAQVRGIRRSVSGQEPVPCFPIEALGDHLPWADHVVNILPANSTTGQLFDAKAFGAMKPGAAFYNIGRGDTVDQDALLATLESGQIGGAYLDVTSPEPLPSTHPLWTAPNCLITPHVAGGMQNEDRQLLEHFVANFKRYLIGDPLDNRIV